MSFELPKISAPLNGQNVDAPTLTPGEKSMEYARESMCTYCNNMDVEQMVCEPSDLLDPSCSITSAYCYQVEGYRHQPSYNALFQSANDGCRICHAFALEIARFLDEDVEPDWDSRLRLQDLDNGQIYLHYPISERFPAQGIFISCEADFEQLRNRRHASCTEADPEESSDDIPLSKAVVIGKIGMYFVPQTKEESLAAQNERRNIRKQVRDRGEEPKRWTLRNPTEGGPIQINPISHAANRFMFRMLKTCEATHDCCRVHNEKKRMPTRLIDLGTGEVDKLRLIHTEKGQTYEYAALSHSWGGKVCYTTTTESIATRESEIRTEDLPANFMHAIVLAECLEIRYVWIDSICIIQDDRDDWAKEAAIMGAIYESSIVTISATTAANSTTGFLQKRRPRFKPIGLQHSSVNPYLSRTIVLRPWLQSWTKCVEGEASPLSSRAWVLQERLLPPRTLHFGHERTFWECRRDLIPEGQCYDEISLSDKDLYFKLGSEWEFNKHFLFPQEDFNYQQYLTERRSYRRVADTSVPEPRSTESLHKTWFYIVQNYSTRKLTFQSDKLVAISGLARRMHTLLGDDAYIAGLWRKNIRQGLLWTAARNGKRNSEYVAPSWSWACMISPVSYSKDIENPTDLWDFTAVDDALPTAVDDTTSRREAEVLNCEVQLVSEDQFGQISSGVMKLSGRWCQIRIEGSDVPPDYASSETDHALFSTWAKNVLPGVDLSDGQFTMAFSDEGRATCRLTEDGDLEFSRQQSHSPHDNNLYIGDAIRFALDELVGPDVFHRNGKWYTFELQHVLGPYYLMVRKDTKEHGRYRRIGLANVIQLSGNKTSIEPGVGRPQRVIDLI